MRFQKTPIPKIVSKVIPPDFAEDNGQWLIENAAELLELNEVGYALIHADDGVLWGRIEGKRLITPPSGESTPPLRSLTVQQCRVFNSKGELFVWRESEGAWKGRLLIDAIGDYRSKEKRAILYGSRVDSDQAPRGFTSIFEPGVGMRQIVPVEVPDAALEENKSDEKDNRRAFKDDWRVTLTVVEYFSEDDDGQLTIACSRLKGIAAARI